MAIRFGICRDRYRDRLGTVVRKNEGSFLLLAAAGHLCCLAGFEISRVWAFFKVDFRPLTVLALVPALAVALWGAQAPPEKRSVSSILLVAWSCVTAFPLLLKAWVSAVLVAVLGSLLSLAALRRKAALAGWAASFVLGGLSFLAPDWLGAVLLFGAAVWETRRREAMIPDWNRGPVPAGCATRAEIYWSGFATLYRSAAPGEGQKFKLGIVRDTLKMVESCGGRLESGTEDRGIYRFPDPQSLEACRRTMGEYSNQVDGVLKSVDAPQLELVFNRKWG